MRLIAHARNRADLQTTLAPFLDDIAFVEDTPYHRAVWRLGHLAPTRLQEHLFGTLLNLISEIYQARIIRALVHEGRVDVIHQPIPVSPRAPSTLYGFGVPVVIGPMNGGMSYPPGYESYEGRLARGFVRVARKAAVLVNRIIPGKRRAAALIVANARTRAALPVRGHPRVIELVENGVDLATWRPPAGARRAEPGFRLVFMGRLIALKGVDMTLEAIGLARAAGVAVELDILGDGPERPRLEALAAVAGLQAAVRFLGFRPQGECVAVLGASDALILNSVRECGGAVVLEAMSLGLPVIAADWGGPADYLDPSCGIAVSPVPRADFPRRLADAIGRLAGDPDRRRRMGLAGAAKVRASFDWERKVDRILEIYDEVLADKPSCR